MPTVIQDAQRGIAYYASRCESGVCHLLDFPEALAGTPEGLTWVNVIVNDREKAASEVSSRLSPLSEVVKQFVQGEPTAAFNESDGAVFLSLRKISTQPGTERYADLGIFATDRLFVTILRQESESMAKWFEKWEKAPELLGDETALLLHVVLDELVDDYYPVTDQIEDEIDDLETALFAGEIPSSESVLTFKRRMLVMRRNLSPVRDVVNALLRRDIVVVGRAHSSLFQGLYDHTLRLIERIDLNRDILADLLDVRLNVISNTTNNIMKALTVISAILMTISVVTGFYGMNFKYMPELDKPYAYPAVIGVIVALCSLEIWLFRRKGWL